MKIPLVWLNLAHDPRRTAVGVLGVTFAAILMFMQFGFLEAVDNTATSIFETLEFDILLTSPTYLYFYDPGTFPVERLDQAASVPGVVSALPLHVGFNTWSWRRLDPGGDPPWEERAIFIIGFRPPDNPFRRDHLADLGPRVRDPGRTSACLPVFSQGGLALLEQPDCALIDRISHPDFGPLALLDPCEEPASDMKERRETGGAQARTAGRAEVVVGTSRLRIAGDFTLPLGFGADGAILVSDQNFSRIFAGRPLDEASLGLIRTRGNPEAVAAALRRRLPADDVRVLTRAEVFARESGYWRNEKALGVIFRLGFLVSCAVGVVFVYQILSSDITNRFVEYATLKAMGYNDRAISWLVVQQALILAMLAYPPALLVSLLLARLIAWLTRLEMEITGADMLSVLVFSALIGALSAFIAIGKVRRADPADLF